MRISLGKLSESLFRGSCRTVLYMFIMGMYAANTKQAAAAERIHLVLFYVALLGN